MERREITLVNHTPWWTRVAVKENDTLINFEVELKKAGPHYGDIFKGKVVGVVPGIQAAFVNIGTGKMGYLYVDDVVREKGEKKITRMLHEGEEIIVQVIREEENEKGPKLSMKLSLPERYLVYLPYEKTSHISSKIRKREVREKLLQFLQKLQGEFPGAFIMRTSAMDATEEELVQEAERLVKEWDNILHKAVNVNAPCLLKEEKGLLGRVLRDYVNSRTEKVIVDSDVALNFLAAELRKWPSANITLKLYMDEQPLFVVEKIEEELKKMMRKRIKLPSGGFIVVEETEAFCGIDVNTGSHTEESDFEETALKINLEAVQEIMRLLRVRNISGLILIDFLNLKKESNQRKVLEKIKSESFRDSAKITFKSFSELGVVEMTRRKTGVSVKKIFTHECPYCGGSGTLPSPSYISHYILNEILWYVKKHQGTEKVKVSVHPEVKEYLLSHSYKIIGEMEKENNTQIIIMEGKFKEMDKYQILPVR